MTAESARRFDALEAQAERIMGVFGGAGYERVAPAILQPAGIFLDRVGEDIRSRAYVFTDQDGNELCLRPDLTIPVCRVYLDRHPAADAAARYSYNGPAFRYQHGAPNPLRPREFRQAGVENFGVTNALAADMEALAVTFEAMRAAGLARAHLKIGDIGLFRGLLAAAPMPERWRARLMAAFWRGDALPSVVAQLSTPSKMLADGALAPLMADIDLAHPEKAQTVVAEYLEIQGVELIGRRTAAEIAVRLFERKADLAEPPLPQAIAELITRYLAISAPAPTAIKAVRALAASASLDLSGVIGDFEARIARLAEAGFAPAKAVFFAETGRRFEYYTGFVFELSVDEDAIPAPIASGGRYDRLLGALGAARETPAVGAAIYTERLLGAVERGAA
ncbi:MAG: ATP phosphoribosyltransferase regulatory subunit [Chitinophagales bacterium]|nr:ATP phosphoribosyltransferase regulatory subunit [Hyphomicrobiales bacterium]